MIFIIHSKCSGFVYLKTNRSTTTPTSPPDEYIDLPEIFSQYNNNNFGEADKVDDSVDFSKTMENWFPKWEFLIKVKNGNANNDFDDNDHGINVFSF